MEFGPFGHDLCLLDFVQLLDIKLEHLGQDFVCQLPLHGEVVVQIVLEFVDGLDCFWVHGCAGERPELELVVG